MYFLLKYPFRDVIILIFTVFREKNLRALYFLYRYFLGEKSIAKVLHGLVNLSLEEVSILYCPVAQSVEPAAVNRVVLGSSPSGAAINT